MLSNQFRILLIYPAVYPVVYASKKAPLIQSMTNTIMRSVGFAFFFFRLKKLIKQHIVPNKGI